MARFAKTLLVFGFTWLLVGAALAQYSTDGISVVGKADLTGKPDFMRMTLTIVGKGTDLKSAVESISARKKKATIKMEKLGAIEDSIKFSTIQIGAGESGAPEQMRRMMQQNFGDSEQAEKLLKVQPPVTTSITVTADWKLESAEEDDALILAYQELKEQIIADDLAGTKEPDKLSPEQEELDAEMGDMMSRYSYNDDSGPVGVPTFSYGKRFSQQDADDLLKKAFADAKAKADRLAVAAQLTLGNLQSLTSRDSSPDMAAYAYSEYGRRAGNSQEDTSDGGILAVSDNPLEVQLSSMVYASFTIK